MVADAEVVVVASVVAFVVLVVVVGVEAFMALSPFRQDTVIGLSKKTGRLRLIGDGLVMVKTAPPFLFTLQMQLNHIWFCNFKEFFKIVKILL